VLYLNLKGHEAQQLEQVLDLATALAHLITSALEKYQVTDKAPAADRLRRSFERYFPPEVAEKRVAEFQKDGGLRATRLEEKQCTVLFAEIAGLNKWLTGARPEQAMEVLNDFAQRFTGIVFSFEGAVAHTNGDSAMAIFGSPVSKGDEALRAVRAALALKADWEKLMSKRVEIDRLRLRMGLSSGKIMVGMVGMDTRLDFTAVGDTVTTASLIAATGEPGQVLITGKTLALIGARFDVNPHGERQLRPGLKAPVFDVLEEEMAQLTSPGVPKPS
jgi:class 3 adenylate cyclase